MRLVLVLTLALAACSSTLGTPPPAHRALGAGEIWLPVVDTHNGQFLCAGGGSVVEIRLHGSSTDPRLTWETLPDGTEHTVVWMPGTSARFAPDLVVIGPDGTVIAREGSLITGGCAMPNGELVEIGPAG